MVETIALPIDSFWNAPFRAAMRAWRSSTEDLTTPSGAEYMRRVKDRLIPHVW